MTVKRPSRHLVAADAVRVTGGLLCGGLLVLALILVLLGCPGGFTPAECAPVLEQRLDQIGDLLIAFAATAATALGGASTVGSISAKRHEGAREPSALAEGEAP